MSIGGSSAKGSCGKTVKGENSLEHIRDIARHKLEEFAAGTGTGTTVGHILKALGGELLTISRRSRSSTSLGSTQTSETMGRSRHLLASTWRSTTPWMGSPTDLESTDASWLKLLISNTSFG